MTRESVDESTSSERAKARSEYFGFLLWRRCRSAAKASTKSFKTFPGDLGLYWCQYKAYGARQGTVDA